MRIRRNGAELSGECSKPPFTYQQHSPGVLITPAKGELILMKKWQIATIGAAVVVAVAGLGASFAGAKPPAPPANVVVLPATVVVANPNWAPSAPAQPRPATLPLAPALPPASGTVLFSADFATADSSGWHSPLLPESDMAPLWLIQD